MADFTTEMKAPVPFVTLEGHMIDLKRDVEGRPIGLFIKIDGERFVIPLARDGDA